MKSKSVIFFEDIAILNAIFRAGRPLTHRAAIMATNEWLKSNQVPENYNLPIAFSRKQWRKITDALIRVGFLEHVLPRGGYRHTKGGAKFMDLLGSNWRKWPLSIPISDDDKVQFDGAIYAPQYRGDL